LSSQAKLAESESRGDLPVRHEDSSERVASTRFTPEWRDKLNPRAEDSRSCEQSAQHIVMRMASSLIAGLNNGPDIDNDHESKAHRPAT
jgi:hypothetical protein